MKFSWISKVIDFLCKERGLTKKMAEEIWPHPEPRNMQQGSVDLHFDGLVATFSQKTIDEVRAERERNSEVVELQHLGMLREGIQPLSDDQKEKLKKRIEEYKEWV